MGARTRSLTVCLLIGWTEADVAGGQGGRGQGAGGPVSRSDYVKFTQHSHTRF